MGVLLVEISGLFVWIKVLLNHEIMFIYQG
jgi:hypothetical protein